MKKALLIPLFLLIFSLLNADGFLFLEVDGIQVHIDDIIFGKNYANSETTASISLDRDVNLTADLSDVLTADLSVMLERGYDNLEFDHININMSGGVGIKGHVYDADSMTHKYTTAAGIGSVNLGSSTWTAPSDYAYLQKDYLYHEGDGGNQNETTFMVSEVSYNPSGGINISLLVDTYKVAYYWDGTDAARHGFVQTWHWEDPSLFPTGTPVIGLTYLPFYVSVNRNVTSETYVVASDTNNNYTTAFAELPEVLDEKLSMIVTLVFDQDTGDFYIGRTANWDNLHDYTLSLPQFIRTGTLSGSSYTFNLSSYKQESGGWTNDQTISGFTRQALNGTGTATVNTGSSTYTLHYYRVE